MTETEKQNRFFPYGTKCPECSYTLGTKVMLVCPECGSPTETLAANGLILEITEQHRSAIPKSVYPKPDRYIDKFIARQTRDIFIPPLVVGVTLWIISVFTLTRLGYRPAYEASILAWLFFTALLVGFPISLIAQYIRGSFRSRQRESAHSDGMKLDRVERYDFELSRALIMSFDGQRWLLIRSIWYGQGLLYLFPPDAIQRLDIDLSKPIGENASLDIIPSSRVVVGFETNGKEIPLRESDSLKPRCIARKLKSVTTAAHESAFLGKRKTKGSCFTSDI